MILKKLATCFRTFRSKGFPGVARVILVKMAKRRNEQPGPVEKVWDDYMSWLSFANAGMLTKENAYCFAYAIANLPSDTPMLEIGSFCGLSTNLITHLKEKYGVKNPLITCDKWLFEGSAATSMLGDSQSISHSDFRMFVKDSYIRNIKMFSRFDLPYTVEALSDEFFEAWRLRQSRTDVLGRTVDLGGPISFCYIDGDHSYEGAMQDFVNVDAFLEPGGFILFDDSGDGSSWGVCDVVQEVMQTNRYELISNNPNYFFRKKVVE